MVQLICWHSSLCHWFRVVPGDISAIGHCLPAMRPPVSMALQPALHQPSTLISLEPLNLLSPETTLAPLNAASEPFIRSLVWTDFRVAVALFVVVPFGLLAASVAARVPPAAEKPDERSTSAETVLRLMTSYWQASSLLLLTVALNVQEANLGVFCGLAAQAMIVVSLWWWSDLSEELDAAPLSAAFRAWRLPTSVAAAGGVVVQLPFQGCVGAESLAGDAFCAPWLEPPKFAAGLVGLDASPALGAVADIGCLSYFAVLSYYATVLLPTVGRSGRAARPKLMDLTPIGAWRALGFLSDDVLAPPGAAAGRRFGRLGAARPLPLADGDVVRSGWNRARRRLPRRPVGPANRGRRAALPGPTAARASARRHLVRRGSTCILNEPPRRPRRRRGTRRVWSG